MEALEVIGKRRSVRSYSSKLVAKEIIEQIVGAGRRVPSGNNVQPWEFIVVTDEAIRKRNCGHYRFRQIHCSGTCLHCRLRKGHKVLFGGRERRHREYAHCCYRSWRGYLLSRW